MNISFIKQYNQQKKAIKGLKSKQALLVEMLFTSWYSLSLNLLQEVAPKSTLQYWLKRVGNESIDTATFMSAMQRVKKENKELGNVYVYLCNQMSLTADFEYNVNCFAQIINSASAKEQSSVTEWTYLFQKAQAIYEREYISSQLDPDDVSELMVKVYLRLLQDVPAQRVVIPFLRNGTLLKKMMQENDSSGLGQVVGWTEDLELFHVMMLNFLVTGIPTKGIQEPDMSAGAAINRATDSIISLFPISSEEEQSSYQRLIPCIPSKNVAVIAVPQSFFVGRRFYKYRLKIFHGSFLRAIVALPTSVASFKRTNMVLLIFSPRKTKGVLLMDAGPIVKEVRRGILLSKEEIQTISDIVLSNKEVPLVSQNVSLSDVLGPYCTLNLAAILSESHKADLSLQEYFVQIEEQRHLLRQQQQNTDMLFENLWRNCGPVN